MNYEYSNLKYASSFFARLKLALCRHNVSNEIREKKQQAASYAYTVDSA